jgi:hypothetical protein
MGVIHMHTANSQRHCCASDHNHRHREAQHKTIATSLLYKTVGSFVAATSVTHFSGFQLRYSTLGRSKIVFFPLKRPEQHWGQPSPNLTDTRRFFQEMKRSERESDHSVLWLRIRWPVTQLPLCAFTARTQAAHFHFDSLLCKGDRALSHRHRQHICHCVKRPNVFNTSTVRTTLGTGSSVILQENFLTHESCAGKQQERGVNITTIPHQQQQHVRKKIRHWI